MRPFAIKKMGNVQAQQNKRRTADTLHGDRLAEEYNAEDRREYRVQGAHQPRALTCGVRLRDGLVAMLPPEHPLAHRASVPATIFETEPFIEIHTGLQTDNTLCFLDRGITPNLSFSTPDSFIACGMVKAGLGVALVNRVIADELSDAVAYVPLDPPEIIDICAVTPSDDVISPAAKAFKSYFSEAN